MRTTKGASSWILGILLIVTLSTLFSFSSPWIIRIYESVDVNSGDICRQTYVCGLQIRDAVRITPFSREVRRLGLYPHEAPHWEVMHTRFGHKRPSSNKYHAAIEGCNGLIEYFDVLALPDESRKSIVQEALQNLETGQFAGIDRQAILLLDRYQVERGKGHKE